MMKFVTDHPYLTAFVVLPTVVGGVVAIAQAVTGKRLLSAPRTITLTRGETSPAGTTLFH